MTSKKATLNSVINLFPRVILVFVSCLLYRINVRLEGLSSTSIEELDHTPVKQTTRNHQPLISIPNDLNNPFTALFHHPYALLLATRKCSWPCSFISNDFRRNMTFTQEGFNHIWIENSTESDLLHSTAPLLLLPSKSSPPTTKRTFVYVFIPPPIQETYKHSSKIDLNIAYNHGVEDSNTLPHEIETVFSKPPYPTSIILPTTPIQLSIPKQINVRIHQYSRIHKVYPTPKDLLKTIHKQIPPRASSSYSKRRNTVAIIGVPQCQHIHPGALAYLKNILTSPTMELHGPHPGSCLSSAKSTPIQGNHYQRLATSVRFVALFIDLLHDSWGGAIVPDLLYHALAWDVNVMIVSRYNYSRVVPPNSVSWIDPTRVDAPGFLREVETRDANWKRDEEWRSGISRTMEAGGSVDVESVLGKDFLKLWYTNVVCDLCESARNIEN